MRLSLSMNHIVKDISTVGEKGKQLLALSKLELETHKIQLAQFSKYNDYPHRALKNKGIVDSGCSRHMTGNKAYLAEFQDFNGGPVAFRGGLACLIAKATIDESNKWHRRLGHVNFKNLNKLVKGNLFAGKSDEGFLVGYSLQSKAFRVYNLETKRVEENLHITFLENKPNVAGKGPTWLFDLDYLTDSMNYQPVRSENQANNHAGPQEATNNAGTEDIIDAGDSDKEDESAQDCFVLPIWTSYSSTITPDLKTDAKRAGPSEEEQVFLDELERLKRQEKEANEEAEALRKKFAQDTENLVIQAGAARASSTNIFSTVSTPAKASSTNLVNTVSTPVSTASPHEGLTLSDPTNPEQDDSEIPPLEDIYQNSSDGIFNNSSYDDEGAVAYFTNLETVCECYSDYLEQSDNKEIHTRRLSFHDRKLISGKAKKQTIVATSTTEAEYVRSKTVWIPNQMIDYGVRLHEHKIYFDNRKHPYSHCKESSISFQNKAYCY
ncbi:putative ribonuclease H-like domain-containing protein [Tanacetum coccineum]